MLRVLRRVTCTCARTWPIPGAVKFHPPHPFHPIPFRATSSHRAIMSQASITSYSSNTSTETSTQTSTSTDSSSALTFLTQHGIKHRVVTYQYIEKGGTKASSSALDVDEHWVIKTLVFQDRNKRPFIVLQHGDLNVDVKVLSKLLQSPLATGGRVSTCSPETATTHTGYLVGGTSPFGTSTQLPIYIEESLLSLSHKYNHRLDGDENKEQASDSSAAVYINGGGRGLLVIIHIADLVRVLKPIPVKVGIIPAPKPESTTTTTTSTTPTTTT